MEASILYTKIYDQDISEAYQKINNTVKLLLNNENISVSPYNLTKKFPEEMMHEIDSAILESLVQQYQNVINSVGKY